MNIPQVMPQGPVVMTQVPMQQQPVVNTVMVNSQGQPLTGPPQAQENNISKVKSLIGPLRESLAATLKTAAQTLHQNSLVDVGSLKNVPPVDVTPPRFDKSMEEFYSICDQIELHLKTSIECMNQNASSQRYLSLTVTPTRTEPIPNQELVSLTYPQYLSTVRTQVSFAKEMHGMLLAAAQNITTTE
ncbi:mediator of RNA polymerase II transcription subunit 29 [Halyomorpha halys]|uniref:mediator of RNA polymerase II transcription subunit 29 n=1 Tax=Halyomorpha halys TaxID=286706 RepID=UPI0006D4CA75|nr:mediator of RNA polymerase II transcription subunit 29 [Halyomorpha halys]XP_014282370.1 mediator of RNA polymerase II transcription subunit 29 [Halyomorpha halys]XP_014282371.1 mediator of RNA polymerase II transcription subunit 29 [Halyomorpha halys]